VWFWGNTAHELRWHRGQVHLWEFGDPGDAFVFDVSGDRIVGVVGYHRGETLHVVRGDDGTVSHLECATFVYTKVPYDPDVAIPGGHP
jgi:hypothetical protein